MSQFAWGVLENIFTMTAAIGTSLLLYHWTGSLHAFWFMLLLVNLNSFSVKK